LKTSPSSGPQGLAYKITEHDRWDVRSAANPYATSSSLPVATRTRVWDVNNQVMTTEETYGWDATNRSHAKTGHWTSTSQSGLGSIDYLSRDELSVQGITALDPPAITSSHTTARGLASDFESWIWGQVPSENTTIFDQSQGLALGQPQPYVAPPVSRTYDDLNRVKEITHGAAGGTTTTVTFTFQDSGSAGAQGQLGSAVLKGITGTTPLALSGQVGASYGYDGNGFMNLIHPTGGWDLQQTQDALGYAKDQTDANGLTTTLQWDAAGRLTGVQPPTTEVGTTVNIDADSLGFVVRRGSEASRVRFNAFGEMVLVQRSLGTASDGSDNWSSHKAFAYDPGGRKLGETIWLPGPGDETEWKNPNLTMPFTIKVVVEGGYWDTEIDEVSGKVHTSWVPPVYGQEVLPKLYDGNSWTFDGQGRLIGTLDPNKIPTKTVYGIRTRTVTRGSGTGDGGAASTTFTSDSQGRLIGVVDALGRSTDYRYDPMGRIVSVAQYSETDKAQVRTWEYNNLGWLTAITQPESGRTEYADFTVQGKPRLTRYGVVNGTPAKTTTTYYDVLGRVIGLNASDFSTSQSFTYDDPTKGLTKGKLTQATADGVSRSMEYSGLNGRLSKLTRAVDGLSFVQTFDYNAYGVLSSRTFPGRTTPGAPGIKQAIGLDANRQMPSSASYNGATLVSMAYDPTSWALSNIAYQGAVVGGNAFFGYDTDQARLKSMVLGTTWTDPATGAPWQKAWNYDYDSRGNLTSDGEDRYVCDLLDRLKDAAVRNPFGTANAGIHQSYSYDAFGNRQSLRTEDITWTSPAAYTVGAVSSIAGTYQFAAGDAALTNFNRLPANTATGVPTGASYDSLGNLLTIYKKVGDNTQAVTLTYDALGRVRTMTDAKRGARETYLHDDEGLRMRVSDSLTGTITYNIYNEARQLVAQFQKVGTGSLTWKKDIVYVGTKEIAEVDATGTEITFVDHLGSPRFAWRGGTTPVIKQKFLPFGESLTDPTSASKFAKGFTNHEQTDPSGLIYMQARFYVPMYGRFLSPDPARDQHFEETQSWNIYSYVRNQPTMAIDPNGMEHYWVVVNQADPKRSAHVYVTRNDGSLRAGYDARAMGSASKGHRRDVKDGDTPYGTARAGRVMLGREGMEKAYGKEKAKAYGEAKINLEATSGELKSTGRAAAGVAVHGGGSPLGENAYDAQQPLLNTQGCIRMHNSDVFFEAQQIQTKQRQGESAIFHVGTAGSLQNEARHLGANVPGVNSSQERGIFQRALDKLKALF
jgi:RHS repeat-associated protein